jgi:hypothetical protein
MTRLLVVVLDTNLSMLQRPVRAPSASSLGGGGEAAVPCIGGMSYAETARSFVECMIPKTSPDFLALFTGALRRQGNAPVVVGWGMLCLAQLCVRSCSVRTLSYKRAEPTACTSADRQRITPTHL